MSLYSRTRLHNLGFTYRFDVMEIDSSDGSWSTVLLLAISVLLFASCGSEESEGPVVLDARVDTSLVLGIDTEKGMAYAFGDPVAVTVDRANRVYVADNDIPAVQVYDDVGTHLLTIGRQGPGPGEFQDIQDLHVHGDTLTVICTTEIEQFNLEGESLRTVGLQNRASWRTLRVPTGHWIFGSYRGPAESDSLFRVYSDSFAPTEAAFGRVSQFVDDNRASRRAVGQHVGSLAMIDNERLLFSPYLYDGRVVEYQPEEGSWRRVDAWSGYTEREAYTYETVGPDASPGMEVQIHAMEKGRHVVVDAMYYNKSLGLFRTGEHVFHFTSIARGEHRLFGAEIYGLDGEMQGYVPLKEVATDENGVPTEITPRPRDAGPDGRFYFIDSGFGRRVRVVGLTMTFDDGP